MKVAVFGSSGFIGRNLCKFFDNNQVETVEFTSKNPFWFEPESGFLKSDFKLPGGIDCIFYLCQSPHYRQGQENVEHLYHVNALLPYRLVTLAAEQGVRSFFYTSTGNVYADHFSPVSEDSALRKDSIYALSKIHGEDLLLSLQTKIQITIFRLFGVFGPHQNQMLIYNLAERVRAGETVILQKNPRDIADKGGIRVSYLFIRDLVEIFYQASLAERLPPVLNVGGPAAVSIKSVCHELEKVLGRPAQFSEAIEFRRTDFIADISLLNSTLKPNFHNFSESLQSSFKNEFTGDRDVIRNSN